MNSRRCLDRSEAAQFRVKFFLDKLGLFMDDRLLDAMSISGDPVSKESISEWYISKYEESIRNSRRGDG